MILAIDIGNTNVVLGVWENDVLRFVSRVETDKLRTSDSYAVNIKSIFELYEVDQKAIEGSIISSVVPQLTHPMELAVFRITGKKPLIVGPGIKTGLNIRIDNPAQLGSDLVVDAVAALSKYPKPIIIFDMGTATTISVIDSNANYLGGALIPGLRVALDALSAGAAQLPQVELSAPPDIIGTNTIDCMQVGAIYGTASMIDGMVQRIEERLGSQASVIATGGNSGEIVAYCRTHIVHDADLLIEGLLRLYKRNAPKA
ncbi:MAG: type III pantothenate kinase [Clostridia bacterium]|nr:type III pantothenate kinase [Clostridia bacterium]MDR3645281.1 type III pantothenate kinase [Clostridia bacterium]